ncbi:MAG: DNA-directed polymerase subunit delta [Bacillota bacterium]|nr:DNA-directed polymerase subunit delta [Bacillota bacterium]MDK2925058.1 DNA-directed polymerase subunit delta [Bacillota bacterium]
MARAGKDKTETQLTLDRCYALLKKTREPMHFRELLTTAWKELWPERELPASALATLYTSLNLDARFVPVGKGKWGLAEWHPRPARSNVPATSLLGKSYQDDRDRLAALNEEADLEESVADTLGTDEDRGPGLEEDSWLGDEHQD